MKQTKRLDKILSNMGLGSRKEIKKMIKDHFVYIDKKEANDGSMQVDPFSSKIKVNGEIINYKEFFYVLLNKPQGVISATWDNKHKTVVDILPEKYKKMELFPVGRLDIDTEGLLIMTNDGKFAHNILSPKKHVPKKYYAKVCGEVTDEDIEKFKSGIVLDDGYKTMPAQLKIICRGALSEIEVTIYEGKFHQVKRMFEACGKNVIYLKRFEMGGIKLGNDLNLGECRELDDDEIKRLKAMIE